MLCLRFTVVRIFSYGGVIVRGCTSQCVDSSLAFHQIPKEEKRGHTPAADQWVFGIVDTSTTPGAYQDRRAVTLIPIIQRVVLPGSIIHSDQWAAYQPLVHYCNYHFQTVNHSQNFVDPATGVHTQSIESYWAKAKHKFKKMKGVTSDQLPSYLDERMWMTDLVEMSVSPYTTSVLTSLNSIGFDKMKTLTALFRTTFTPFLATNHM